MSGVILLTVTILKITFIDTALLRPNSEQFVPLHETLHDGLVLTKKNIYLYGQQTINSG